MRLLFDQYIRFVTNFPKTVLLLIAIIAAALAMGLPHFKLDASADSLTLEHDTDLQYFREMSRQYKSGDFLVVTFRPHSDLMSDDSIALLGELKADLAAIDGVVGVNSILDVPLLYSPKQSVSEIITSPRTLLTPGVDREQARREFLDSPIYRNLILGPDGQTTALQLNIAIDEGYMDLVQKRDALRYKRDHEGIDNQEREALEEVSREFLAYRTTSEAQGHDRVQQVRAVVSKYKDRAQIFVGGITMITADMITFIQSDLVVFGTAVILFMVLILAFIFRKLRYVVIPMITCLTAVLMMLGYVSWLDWRLTVISSNFVALLLIISLAIIIHLIVRYREYAAEQPEWSQQQLVIATVKFMARPCLYTALTTIVAFASLVISDISPVIDFGWMMTIGLVLALILAFLIMPACLMLLSPEKFATKGSGKEKKSKPLTLFFSSFVENHGKLVLCLSGVMAILAAIGIAKLEVENRFIDYFHESTEIYQGLSVIDNNLGGTTSLDIVITSPISIDDSNSETFEGEDDPFAEDESYGDDSFADDPFADESGEAETTSAPTSYWLTVAGLKRVEKIHDYLESLPEVGKVQSLATLYKVGKDLNGGLNDFELAILTRSLSPEVKDVLISPFVPAEADNTRVSLRIRDTYPGLQRKELVERIREHLFTVLEYTPEQVKTTGLLVLYNNMLQSLFTSQIVTLGAVFLGILFMFIILFRSFTLAIVAIVPNILAALSILGTMGLAGFPLDMMTITIAAITVGIGVDDTIHYIHRFKEELVFDGDYIAAMHRSHASIGQAMYYTTLIIVFGFSIMILSEFIPTIYFGLLTGLAMFYALMGALLLLPKLILMTRPFQLPKSESVSTPSLRAT